MNTTEIQNQLNILQNKYILRLQDAAPRNCPACHDKFEQWRDAFALARKHFENKEAATYAEATLDEYLQELKTHDITTL